MITNSKLWKETMQKVKELKELIGYEEQDSNSFCENCQMERELCKEYDNCAFCRGDK
jgi:hypothetical protein